MASKDLIGYLFDLLDPDDRVAVEARLEADPNLAARLESLRIATAPMLAVMDVERDDPPTPPAGLAVRAIGTAARKMIELEPPKPDSPVPRSAIDAFLREYAPDTPAELEFASGTRARAPHAAGHAFPSAPPPTDGPDYRGSGRIRAEMLVAFSIALVAVGLVLSGIARARYENRVYACQNSLRALHTGLTGYADSNPQGQYPQIGTAACPTAETFVPTLKDYGFLPADYKPGCPAASDCPTYTYTLGFRGPNEELVGLRRPGSRCEKPEEFDLMPIAADYPTSGAAPGASQVSPHNRCMNVLFVGGNVRCTTSPNIGPHGDHIYFNVHGKVAAGVNRADAVLGGAGTRP